jgi:hypothetical protein
MMTSTQLKLPKGAEQLLSWVQTVLVERLVEPSSATKSRSGRKKVLMKWGGTAGMALGGWRRFNA